MIEGVYQFILEAPLFMLRYIGTAEGTFAVVFFDFFPA
jgi:hypothetical protein